MGKTANEIFIEKNRKLNQKRDKRSAVRAAMRAHSGGEAAAKDGKTPAAASGSGKQRKNTTGK